MAKKKDFGNLMVPGSAPGGAGAKVPPIDRSLREQFKNTPDSLATMKEAPVPLAIEVNQRLRAAKDEEPSTADREPSIADIQPSDADGQSSTVNLEISTSRSQPSAVNREPSGAGASRRIQGKKPQAPAGVLPDGSQDGANAEPPLSTLRAREPKVLQRKDGVKKSYTAYFPLDEADRLTAFVTAKRYTVSDVIVQAVREFLARQR